MAADRWHSAADTDLVAPELQPVVRTFAEAVGTADSAEAEGTTQAPGLGAAKSLDRDGSAEADRR